MAGNLIRRGYREPSRLGPGSRIADYVIEEQIGAGGMAVVFRARDEVLGRLAAVKVLSPEMEADGEFRLRFLRESRAIATVDEPHVLPVYAAGESGGVLYIATRFVADGDLVRLLYRSGGKLSPKRTAALIGQIAAALDAAHAIGLVHRDVKPANVLVDSPPGRPEHAYLSDFGLIQSDWSMASRLTADGFFVGTPDYCAPEQITGQTVSGSGDQYALGCVAFHLLTGTVPFPRADTLAVLYAHVHEPPPMASAFVAGLSSAVDAVLGRALDKRPAARYDSCGRFAAALAEALEAPQAWGAWPAEPARATATAAAAYQEAPWTGHEPPWTGAQLPVPPSAISSPPTEIPPAGLDDPVSSTRKGMLPAPGRRQAVTRGAHAKSVRANSRTRVKLILGAAGAAVLAAAVLTGLTLTSKPGDDVTLTAPAGAQISNDEAFVMSPDGEYFAAGGAAPNQSKLYVWNATTGQLRTTLDLPPGPQAFALGFTENDKALVAFSGPKTKVYQIVLSTGQRTAIGTAPASTNAAISGDLSTSAVENAAGTGIDVATVGGTSIAPLMKNPAKDLAPHSLRLDESGDELIVCDERGTAYILNTQTDAVITTLHFHSTAILPFPVLSPDGSTVLVPVAGNGAELWSVGAPGSPSVNITPHNARWPTENAGYLYSSDGGVIMTFPDRETTNDLWQETGAHIITRTDPGSQDEAVLLLGSGGHKLVLGQLTRGGSAFTDLIVRDIPRV